MHKQFKSWIVFMVLFFIALIYPTSLLATRNIAGIDTPNPINPTVVITNSQYAIYQYHILLGRDPDPDRLKSAIRGLDGGNERLQFFKDMFISNEFRTNSSLTDKTQFVTRLYTILLRRTPTLSEISYWAGTIQDVASTDGSDWYNVFIGFFAVPEYKSNQCQTEYYSYGSMLNPQAPTLNDLFNGQAHFQSIEESQLVTWSVSSNIWANSSTENEGEAVVEGSKLPILYNQDDGKYYGFTRGMWYFGGNNNFNIYMLQSSDGMHFTNVGRVFDKSPIPYLIDPHIAIDYSVCPTQYIMAIEVGGATYSSTTTTPFNISSWSYPVPFVWTAGDNARSASTPVFLIDGVNKYASWTVLDTVLQGKTQDVGTESTYSKGIKVDNFSTFLGNSDIGSILMPAEKDIHCTSSWDCNNRDKQDWKKEGEYFYQIYNGANYYGCDRYPNDRQYTNDWGIGITRSKDPLSGYNLAGVGRILHALHADGCRMSYPVINAVGGELYLYYAYFDFSVSQLSLYARSKLVWNTPQTSPSPTPSPSPSYSLSDLKSVLSSYLGNQDQNFKSVNNKINSLDASYVIRWLH